MIRCYTYILVFAISLVASSSVFPQFINIQIVVEPELSATVEQNLNFGEIVTNTGKQEISLGDVNMGVFTISALNTQNVFISLDHPNELVNLNPAIPETIPLYLDIAYNNTGDNEASESILLSNNFGFIPIHNNITEETDIWEELFVYVYGYIEVGDIPSGIYEGNIILTVEYD